MKVKNLMIAGAVATAMMAGSSLALAAEGTNAGGKKGDSTQAQAVANLATAESLVAYGDANKDAMALIVAAKMLKAAPVKPGDATKTSDGGGADKAGAVADYSVAAVLARAKQYAAGNKALIGLADDVAAASSKGRLRGAIAQRDRVYAHRTDVWRIVYRGGEEAAIAIRGDGDTDLDFYVYDENNNLIVYDTDSTDYTVLRWNPRWTGPFTIKVKNRGGISNRYRFATN